MAKTKVQTDAMEQYKHDKELEISVVMPTCNTPLPILWEAVESILNQTYRYFEFIIINDGSTNGSKEYLESLTDPRIVLINNASTQGIPKSLNMGIDMSRGKYIARMDADDISLPMRFEKQLRFMKSHPEVTVCGTNYEDFGIYNSKSHWIIKDRETRRIALLFCVADICHPTVMMDRKQLVSHNIHYNEAYIYAQDYGMWVDIFKVGDIAVIDDVLVRKRSIENQVSISKKEEQRKINKTIQKEQLKALMGNVTDRDVDLHFSISHSYDYPDLRINDEIVQWSKKLILENDNKNIYHRRKFAAYVYANYIRVLYHSIGKEKNMLKKLRLLFRYFPKTIAGIEALILLYKQKRIK